MPNMKSRAIALLSLTALLSLLLAGCGPAVPSTGSVYGTVFGWRTGLPAPVSNAQVTLDSGPSYTTLADGAFRFSSVPAGTRTITVTASGYRTTRQSVYVPKGGDVNVRIDLVTGDAGDATITGTATLVNRSVPTVKTARSASSTLRAVSHTAWPSASPFSSGADYIQVKLRAGVGSSDARAELIHQGYEIVRELPLSGVTIVRRVTRTGSVADVSAEAAAFSLEALPAVEWAYPDYVMTALQAPHDEYYGYQWHYPAISLPEAWDVTTGSASRVVVAVIDSGIRPSHPDLVGKIVPGWDFIDNDPDPTDQPASGKASHGTHVAGTIGAVTNNGIGVAGVSWGAMIMPIRVLDADGRGSSATVAEAILWAVDHGADVINLSLGMEGNPGPAVADAISTAYSRGVSVVAAAGNSPSQPVNYPAAYPTVIAVSATDRHNELAPYSAHGPEITVAAPGGNLGGAGIPGDGILSTGYIQDFGVWKEGYHFMDGTSMATPHVSGLLALLVSRYGRMSPDELRSLVCDTAMDLDPPGRDDKFGAGLINAYAAVTGSTMDRAVFGVYDTVKGEYIGATTRGKRDRSFTILGVPAGNYTLVGWLDVNGNFIADAGDFFNHQSINVPPSGTLRVDEFQLLYLDSQPRSIDGSPGAFDTRGLLVSY